jgi:hypothetical protein
MWVLAAIAFLCSVFWTQEIGSERELETEQGFIGEQREKNLDRKAKIPNFY